MFTDMIMNEAGVEKMSCMARRGRDETRRTGPTAGILADCLKQICLAPDVGQPSRGLDASHSAVEASDIIYLILSTIYPVIIV